MPQISSTKNRYGLFYPLSESLKYLLSKFIFITFLLKSAKIKSQIDVDLFTYIWLSKITLQTLKLPNSGRLTS